MGIFNALLGITLLPASLIAGVLYDKVNSGIPFFFGAVTALISAVLMLIYFLKYRNHRALMPPIP